MNTVYVVMLDDYDSGWPDGIFDNKQEAINLAEARKSQYSDFQVLEYIVNEEKEFREISQEVYNTSEKWKMNHKHLL